MNFNQNNTTITTPGNFVVNTSNDSLYNSSGSYDTRWNEDFTDFFELVLAALGQDITYDDFKKMSKQERNQLMREIKLKTIL
jgi:hypothetical protein